MTTDLKKRFEKRLEAVRRAAFPVGLISLDLSEVRDRPMDRGEVETLWREYFRELSESGRGDALHVYAHTPFCRSKCLYCNCDSRPISADESLDAYASAVVSEARLYGKIADGYPASSVYFGGGTATLYPEDVYARFISRVIGAFRLLPGALVCCEMNPDSATRPKMEAAARCGANRVSFGVQSLTPRVLANANRAYQTRAHVETAIRAARELKFGEVNADLIAFIEGETPESFAESSRALAGMGPTHITMYRGLPAAVAGGMRRLCGIPEGFSWEEAVRVFAEAVGGAGYNVDAGRGNVFGITAWRKDASPPSAEGVGVFSMSPRSVVGLGAWARSMILNRAVYGKPNVYFSLDDARYVGHLTDAATDARLAAVHACVRRVAIDAAAFRNAYGIDVETQFGAELETLEAAGLGQWVSGRFAWTTDDEAEIVAAATLFYTDEEFAIMERLGAERAGHAVSSYPVFAAANRKETVAIGRMLGAPAGGEKGDVVVAGAEWLMGDIIQVRLRHAGSVYRIWIERKDDKPAFAASDFLKIYCAVEGAPDAVRDWMQIFAIRLKGKRFEDLAECFTTFTKTAPDPEKFDSP